MDSSVCHGVMLNIRKLKAQDSMMVTCNRSKFMETYHGQNFSMPDSVIFYIAKNPKTAKLYLKMVKSCKYFFIKNPIFVIDRFFCGKPRAEEKPLNLTKYNCKYWITDEIYSSAFRLVDKNIFTSIIPKLYQCDVKRLRLSDQIISFNDLSLLISSAEWIGLFDVIVKKCDSIIPLEDIVAIAVKAKAFDIITTITPKTMKELTKLPNFLKLDEFKLFNLSEVFDIDEFYDYMKKNQHTKFSFSFNPQISDAFKNRLETIVDEILETIQFTYKPPVFNFAGLDIHKSAKLYRIYHSH